MGALNFYGAAQSMMNVLQSRILGAFASILPIGVLMNICFLFMGGILIFHIFEGIVNAGKTGNTLDAYNIIKEVIRTKALRLVVYCLLAIGSLVMVNGGWTLLQNAYNNHSWAYIDSSATGPNNTDLASDWGVWAMDWLGSNALQDVTITNADGTQTTIQNYRLEAPPIIALKSATNAATTAIDGLNAATIYTSIDKEIAKTMNLMPNQIGAGNLADIGSMGATMLLRECIDQFLNLVNHMAFLWAQWTLCRTLVVQCLFMQMSWHLGLYFLPLFILMAYFRTTHGFLVNLVINYAAMMIASYVMATLAMQLFKANVWTGTYSAQAGAYVNGIIPAAFANVKMAATTPIVQYPVATFPWLALTYAQQIARGQIIWLMGAVGLILGQVYEMVRGILGGSFRSYFNPGSAGTGALFGGK